MRTSSHSTDAETAGRELARQTPPITAEQARAAARILATVKPASQHDAA